MKELSLEEAKKIVLEKHPEAESWFLPKHSVKQWRIIVPEIIFGHPAKKIISLPSESENAAWLSAAQSISEGRVG